RRPIPRFLPRRLVEPSAAVASRRCLGHGPQRRFSAPAAPSAGAARPAETSAVADCGALNNFVSSASAHAFRIVAAACLNDFRRSRPYLPALAVWTERPDGQSNPDWSAADGVGLQPIGNG